LARRHVVAAALVAVSSKVPSTDSHAVVQIYFFFLPSTPAAITTRLSYPRLRSYYTTTHIPVIHLMYC